MTTIRPLELTNDELEIVRNALNIKIIGMRKLDNKIPMDDEQKQHFDATCELAQKLIWHEVV